jgi:hypothetical protein
MVYAARIRRDEGRDKGLEVKESVRHRPEKADVLTLQSHR